MKQAIDNLIGLGWKKINENEFEKENKKLRIGFVEGTIPRYVFGGYKNDFLIAKKEEGFLVIPKELLGNLDYPSRTYKRLLNKFMIIGTKNKVMLNLLMEYGFKGSDIGRTGLFFPELRNKREVSR